MNALDWLLVVLVCAYAVSGYWQGFIAGAFATGGLLMGGVLGWDEAQTTKEIDAYQARVEAERRSQQVPDDETADELRLRAPEIVPLER